MKRIALFTDLRPHSDRALDRAALIADATGARLGIVHATGDGSGAAAAAVRREVPRLIGAEGNLSSALALDAPVPADWTALQGEASSVLGEYLRSGDAELIVVGTGREFTLSKIVLGSTVDRIVADGDRPVLVVKRRPIGAYRRVAAAFDGSARSSAALKSATRAAPGADLTIVHSGGALGEDDLRRQVDAVLSELRAAGDTVPDGYDLILTEGAILEAMMAFDKTGMPDLAAFGQTARGGLHRLIPGSTTQLLMAHLTCDTLVGGRIPR